MSLMLDLALMVRSRTQLFSFNIVIPVDKKCSNVREMIIFSPFFQDFGQVRETLKLNFQEIIRVGFEGACLIVFFFFIFMIEVS